MLPPTVKHSLMVGWQNVSKDLVNERMQQHIRRLSHKHPGLYGNCTYTLIMEVITELDRLDLVIHS